MPYPLGSAQVNKTEVLLHIMLSKIEMEKLGFLVLWTNSKYILLPKPVLAGKGHTSMGCRVWGPVTPQERSQLIEHCSLDCFLAALVYSSTSFEYLAMI